MFTSQYTYSGSTTYSFNAPVTGTYFFTSGGGPSPSLSGGTLVYSNRSNCKIATADEGTSFTYSNSSGYGMLISYIGKKVKSVEELVYGGSSSWSPNNEHTSNTQYVKTDVEKNEGYFLWWVKSYQHGEADSSGTLEGFTDSTNQQLTATWIQNYICVPNSNLENAGWKCYSYSNSWGSTSTAAVIKLKL